MSENELKDSLNKLLRDSENEVVEFKEAKNDYSFEKLGEYFSALSNEARLKNQSCAWLVFGVDDQRQIIGTLYRSQGNDRTLDSLKHEISTQINSGLSFIDIHELIENNKRIVMFQIPPAPVGLPVAFKGHFYGRNGESLGPLNLYELDRLRAREDWSAGIIPNATIDDLDPDAIAFARKQYEKRNPNSDIINWDNSTFLNKAKITIQGNITRTAIILLGKEESAHYLTPFVVHMSWILKDINNNNLDYAHFYCPFMLAIDKVLNKIRNTNYTYLQDGTLYPENINRYEPYTIREAINNCIAHQDYKGIIRIIEVENDKLIFTNTGNFIPGTVEKVIQDNAPESIYRNPFLAQAMVNLNMVETIGSGIRKMFDYQSKRFFPMPEYDLSDNQVKLTITGKVLDWDYAKALKENTDLLLEEIIMLDKVQKKKPLTSEEEKHLKSKKLIEGRKPNYHISVKIAQAINQKAEYTLNKGFNDDYYKDLIIKGIKEHGSLDRKTIDELLMNKLPNNLTNDKKDNKIRNLIQELRSSGRIQNEGTTNKPKWVMTNNED